MDPQDSNMASSALEAAPKPPTLSPPVLAIIGGVLSFGLGIAASRGLISKETATYFAGPETMAFVSTVGAAIVIGIRAWANRPHGLIQSTNQLAQVDAVIVKPKTAAEINVSGIVGTVDKAAEVVHAARIKHAATQH